MKQTSGFPSTTTSGAAMSPMATLSMPPHYRPYSNALKETPFLAPKFQRVSPPTTFQIPPPHHYTPSAFLPPLFTSESSSALSKSGTRNTPSLAPPINLTMHHTSHVVGSNSAELSMASSYQQRDGTHHQNHHHLQQMNNELLHKVSHLTEHVREWESWYMTVRHELDACKEAQARAAHWQEQAQEMQRQKAVMSARVRRWQRWAKAYKRHKTSHSSAKDGSKENPTSIDDMPREQDVEESRCNESVPRPFKKRRFETGSDAKEDDSVSSKSARESTAVAAATGTSSDATKVPRSILKVRTASEWRCSTPQDGASTNVAPVTPSPQSQECTFAA